MEKTKTSDAQKRASAKYIAAKRDRVTLNAPKGKRGQWEEAAARRGLSLNAWSISTLDAAAAQVLQDQQPEPEPEPETSPAEDQTVSRTP